MRVLYFHQHFSTPAGSTGTRSYEMAQRLIARGHQVTMVCGSGKMARSGLEGSQRGGFRRGLVDGIDVIELDIPYSNYDGLLKRSWLFALFALRSIKLALTLDYDLLFATSTPLTAGIPGIVMKLFRNKPFVFEVRDLWPELPREMGVIRNPLVLSAMGVLEWLSYHSANACIGLSPGIVKGIMRRGISADKVAMVPNGCDLELFEPKRNEVLRAEGIDKDDFVAVFTGAHGMANGLGAILDAAAELKKKSRNDIKLLFIGDGKLKPGLVKRAVAEGLDNCLFMDPVPKTVLTAYLKGADAGLMTLANVPAFYYGTSPNKFFDYIAMGMPVINNYPGWLAEMITEHKCGLAVPPDNPQAFAAAIEKMADDRTMARQAGINARTLAELKFDRTDLGNQLVDRLERVYQG